MSQAKAAEAKALGNAALAQGDFAAAIKHYTEAIANDPHDHIFYSNRSAAYLSKGDVDLALKDAEKCTDMRPDWGKGWGRVGAALFAKREYSEAAVAYSKGVKADPSNAALQEGLANAKAEDSRVPAMGGMGGLFGKDILGRLAQEPKFAAHLADPSFVAKVRLLEADPNSLGSLMGGGGAMDPRMMEVLAFLLGRKAGDGGPGGPGEEEDDAEMDTAGSWGESSAPGGASEDYASSSARRKEEAAAVAAAAAAEEAARAAAAAAAEEAADPELAAKRGRKREAVAKKEEGTAAYKARRFEDALASYRAAWELDGEDITHLLNIAAVHLETGDLDGCIATCRDAVERGRAAFAPYPLIAKAFARIGNAENKRSNIDAAIEAYESSLLESQSEDITDKLKKLKVAKKKRDAEAYVDPVKANEAKERGNDLFKAGDFVGAIKEYSEAIKRDPSSAVFLANRAAAEIKLMDWSSASADLDASLKLDPKYTRAYVRRGALQVGLREYHKALESYRKALELEPGNAEATEGMRTTIAKINAGASGSGKGDEGAEGEAAQRAQRAMQDPEIQAILHDPMVNSALEDMQKDAGAYARVMRDKTMAAKIQKLIAAGVVGMK